MITITAFFILRLDTAVALYSALPNVVTAWTFFYCFKNTRARITHENDEATGLASMHQPLR